ncbi:MAG: hypothetical protein PSN36_02920 [Gammaproteobacteria bacterium]|nr:hypothetical protein [Gammaproteobacteria bacterium]
MMKTSKNFNFKKPCIQAAGLFSLAKSSLVKRKSLEINIPPLWHNFRLFGILDNKNLVLISLQTTNLLLKFNYKKYTKPLILTNFNFWHTFRLFGILVRLFGIKPPPLWHKTSASLAYKKLILKLNINYKKHKKPFKTGEFSNFVFWYNFRLFGIPYNYNNQTIYINNVKAVNYV